VVPEDGTRNARDDGDLRERAPVDLEAGQVIAGKYSIERLLGRGGMGTVWLCTHLGLHERVAVKVMSRQVADNAEVRARFEREARASAKIKSRYVARVHDTGELPDGRPYLVMEFMEGETLGQALQAARTMSVADTVRILGQVGRGLARAHELGIVHRDVKPDNVFLAHTADDGVIAKVFDFGIVKVSDALSVANDMTQEGALLGTPQYMSPEQVEGLAIDHRSDVYALGVMAYRMLTGKRLFPGESLSTTLMKICNGPLPRLNDALPDLPPAVDAWFQRACARDREQRFDSTVECVEALASAVGVATLPDISFPPPPVASPTAPGSDVALPAAPLETPTGLSAVQRTTPPAGHVPPPDEARADGPRSRRGIAVLGGAAVLGVLALLFVSRGTHAPAAQEPVSATMATPPPPLPAPPSSATVALPVLLPAAAASAPSPQADAGARPGARPTPRRQPPRTAAPAASSPSGDERIHDVGY
jgi:serine/threonine-protein kinase